MNEFIHDTEVDGVGSDVINASSQSTRISIHYLWNKVLRRIYSVSSRKRCYICNQKSRSFLKYRGGQKGLSEFIRNLDMVGSDVENFACCHCNCHDRERHLFMYFDKLDIWNKMAGANVLHFAPGKFVEKKIMEQKPERYVKADLFPAAPDILRIDCTDIKFNDNQFDFVLANHVLEHVPDYKRALSEIHRVLKPGGMAVLQTPYSRLLKRNFEETNINSDEARLFFFGQEDHVRVFGFQQFQESIEQAGFDLSIIEHSKYFSDRDAFYYGVNKEEPFLLIIKPMLT